MSQYRLMGRLLTAGTVVALSSVGCFVVDDKKSADENGGEATGGSSGSSSGSGGSISTGGSKATGGAIGSGGTVGKGGTTATGGVAGEAPTGGTGGGTCAADGATCSVNGDCCGFPDTYCVGGACAPLCTANTDCGTGCCADLMGGGKACGPAEICGGGGGAVMKFCNVLTKNGADVTLTVDFGGVRASTISGTCTPVVPNPCIAISTGTDVPVDLYDGTTMLYSATFNMVATGDELLVIAQLDTATSTPMLDGGTFDPMYVCAQTDPLTAALQADSAGIGSSSFAQMFVPERSHSLVRQGDSKLAGYGYANLRK